MVRNNFARGIAIVLLLIAAAGISYGVYRQSKQQNPNPANTNSSADNSSSSSDEPKVESNQIIKDTPPASPAPTVSQNGLVFPIAQFKERITKKPFGIYITPQSSPVQPERFTGYHTAVDVEYQEVTDDVPVFAINDCQVIVSRIAQGYGGVFVVSTEIKGTKHSIIYGHIRPSSLPKANARFKKGAQIAFLGAGYSSETDGERRHLHFGVLTDSGTDLRGYVQNKDELSGWIDPLTIF